MMKKELPVRFSFYPPCQNEHPTKSHAWLTTTDDAQLLRKYPVLEGSVLNRGFLTTIW
ncbi:hypothetical protein GQ55_2G393100 [Panicum hallii var. hallii]|uniref:Uncharacterized protein n=1 Tax=Panicum hallii var. hallii TaxID=1504633 RepID=A0A2T7EX76_9POAL|nr:hypothetical protein GQ55_2G393100 [Panicum hallii var. hallii]